MSAPALSVVVAAGDSAEAVAHAVASIRARAISFPYEIVVAAATDRIDPAGAPEGVTWIAAPAGLGVPGLRRLGLDRARAPVVVFTEDSCRFAPGWLDAWRLAFDDPATVAATGPIEPAMGDSLVDWAVFFCEYAAFLNSRGNPPTRLAGNNFAVRRADCAAIGGPAIHEWEVLRRTGGRVVNVADALAFHVRRYAWREAVGDRLRFGLAFGRLRGQGRPRWRRAPALLAGPAILAIQLGRLTRTILEARRCVGRFVTALPITLALLSAWSLGESAGWALAPAPRDRAG